MLSEESHKNIYLSYLHQNSLNYYFKKPAKIFAGFYFIFPKVQILFSSD